MTDPDFHLRREVNDATRAVFGDVCRAVERLVDALGGIEVLEQAAAAREAWEAEHPGIRWGRQCHCYCARAGHPVGICEGDAVTFDVRMLYGQPVQVFLCQPCADQVRA